MKLDGRAHIHVMQLGYVQLCIHGPEGASDMLNKLRAVYLVHNRFVQETHPPLSFAIATSGLAHELQILLSLYQYGSYLWRNMFLTYNKNRSYSIQN